MPASATTSIAARTRAIRDAAKDLSALRDAEALLETYARLQVRFAGEVDWRRLVGVRRALVARRRELAGDGTLPERIAAFGEELRAVRGRLPSWKLADLQFGDLAPGFERAYRRGRKAMRAIEAAPCDERFHEWRKRAKDHRYHLELLRDLWPAQVKARRAEVRALGDLLGDEHDLSVLRATLEAEALRFGDGASLLLELARAAAGRAARNACGRRACGCTPSGRRRWCDATDSTGRHGSARADATRSARRPDRSSPQLRCGVRRQGRQLEQEFREHRAGDVLEGTRHHHERPWTGLDLLAKIGGDIIGILALA